MNLMNKYRQILNKYLQKHFSPLPAVTAGKNHVINSIY